MTPPYLIVKRIPYEEPYHTELTFQASNGVFSGSTGIFCNVSDLSDIGDALAAFPRHAGDEYVYDYGSDAPDIRRHHYLVLRAYMTDSTGHCAIQFTLNLCNSEPDEGVCTFSIKAEPAAINRLGQLLQAFAKLMHLELHWSPTGGKLYESYQDEPQ